jgi:biopolymer transport protein ExbD
MHFRRKIRKIKSKHNFAVLDLTAMTDIIFIMLIFFILTSNVAQNVFDLEIPKADENYTEEKGAGNAPEIKITLFTNGNFAIGEKRFYHYNDLKKEISSLYKQTPEAQFLLITESTLPVQTLMELLTFFKSQKITKVDVLLRKK